MCLPGLCERVPCDYAAAAERERESVLVSESGQAPDPVSLELSCDEQVSSALQFFFFTSKADIILEGRGVS